MIDILLPVSSFLGGALLALVITQFAYVSRLTRVETTLAILCKTVSEVSKAVDEVKANRSSDISRRLATAEAKLNQQSP